MSKLYNVSLKSNFFKELTEIILKEKDVRKVFLPNNRSCRVLKENLSKTDCVAPEIVSISEVFKFPDVRFLLLNFLRKSLVSVPFNTLFDLADSLSSLIRNLIINNADYKKLIIPDQFNNCWEKTLVILDKVFEDPKVIELKKNLELTWREYIDSLSGEKIVLAGIFEENFYNRLLYDKALDCGIIVTSGLENKLGDNYKKIRQQLEERWDQLEIKEFKDEKDLIKGDHSLIEVMNNADESLVVALITRSMLDKNKSVLIVCSNLFLIQKIKMELLKWNVIADDSSGVSLDQTVCGQIISQIICMIEKGFQNVDVINFLKFKNSIKDDVLAFEELLRKKENYPLDFFSTFELFLKEERNKNTEINAKKERKDENATQCVLNLFESSEKNYDVDHAEGVLPLFLDQSDAKIKFEETSFENILEIVEELKNRSEYPKNADFNFWIEYFSEFIKLVNDSASEEFTDLLEPQDCKNISLLEFCIFLKNHFFNKSVRKELDHTSGVKILGILESQMIDADLIIIAGANEDYWVPSNSSDFWMSDSMLRQLDINTIDSKNEIYACIWEKLINKPNVIVTRSLLEKGEQSQCYNRLKKANLSEDTVYKELLKKIKIPLNYSPIEFESPVPEIKSRPTVFWVTDLDLLINNPYVYYAKKILRLKEVGRINEKINIKGNLIHQVLDEFVKKYTPDCGVSFLKQIFKQVCRERFVNFDILGLWYFRIDSIFKFFMNNFHKDSKSFSEIEGYITLNLPEKNMPVKIASKADRIEVDPSGKISIIDYKTGKVPSKKQIESCEKVQLSVEALIASKDGFNLGKTCVENMCFWPMKSNSSKIVSVSNSVEKSSQICEDTLKLIETLLIKYMVKGEPYQVNFNDSFNKAYMQLARAKEIVLTGNRAR